MEEAREHLGLCFPQRFPFTLKLHFLFNDCQKNWRRSVPDGWQNAAVSEPERKVQSPQGGMGDVHKVVLLPAQLRVVLHRERLLQRNTAHNGARPRCRAEGVV